MVMKAKGGKVVGGSNPKRAVVEAGSDWRERDPETFPETIQAPAESTVEDGDKTRTDNNMDELVMILMPRVAYDAFQKLALEHGGSAAETMSVALKLLQNKIDEEAKNGT